MLMLKKYFQFRENDYKKRFSDVGMIRKNNGTLQWVTITNTKLWEFSSAPNGILIVH